MMKWLAPLRQAWLLIVLLILLAAFSGLIAIRRQQLDAANQVFIPYSSRSAQNNGSLALYSWLGAIGYRVQRIENQEFRVGDEVQLLFVLGPSEEIAASDARLILNWVARGNVLVTADEGFLSSNGLFQALDVRLDPLNSRSDSAALEQPLLGLASGPLATGSDSALKVNRADFVQYASAENKPLLIRFPYGKGVIWLSSAPNLFSNENLRSEPNAQLVQAFVSTISRGGVIAFDEYHLGFKPEAGASLLTLLYNTPWGWAVIFAFLVVMGYLLLNGRRFGRAMPARQTLARRTPSEYVVSMANLFRRANKRSMVLDHYRRSLKRRLGRPFHLDPELPDNRYIELLTRMRPDLNSAELERILAALRRSNMTEADLVRTVEQSIEFGARRSSIS